MAPRNDPQSSRSRGSMRDSWIAVSITRLPVTGPPFLAHCGRRSCIPLGFAYYSSKIRLVKSCRSVHFQTELSPISKPLRTSAAWSVAAPKSVSQSLDCLVRLAALVEPQRVPGVVLFLDLHQA